jgi:DNA-binding CsgD family transcriptional regulator
MRIKANTARSYLKQIFQKTGVRRQSELIYQFLSNSLRLRQDFKPELV